MPTEYLQNPGTNAYFASLLMWLALSNSIIRIIPKVLEEYSSKNKEARARVLQYVREMLGTYPAQMFEKYMGLLTKVISNSLTDSHPNARSFAREAYLKFEELYPKKADEIYRQLPLIAQKYIEDAKSSSATKCKTPNPVRVKDKKMVVPKKIISNDDSNIQINIIPDTTSHNAPQLSPEDEEAKVVLSVKGRTVHSKSQTKQKSLQESSFDDILIDIESKVWSRRVEAIEEIIEILKNSIECTNNGQLFKAIQVMVAHMSDVHPSVGIINR
jgi:CLASP N terminal